LAAVLRGVSGEASLSRLLSGSVDDRGRWARHKLAVVEGLASVGSVVADDRRRHDDAFGKIPTGLETHGVGAVLDDLELAGVDVDVTVPALDTTVGKSGLQLEGSI